jgi:formylglycine-generating enzyme required for sulfatase activity
VNPLLLSIIALVHRYRATLPKRRVDLYAECVDVLLGHWDTAKGLLGKLDAGQKRAVLQSLALTMQCEKRRELSRRDLTTRVATLLPGVGAAAVEADEFLDEVRERSGLLVETGLDTYAFSHQTFQEYLAARALVDAESRRETLLARLREPWWQETVLLYVGMTDATPIIAALLDLTAREDLSGLLLAGRGVAEAIRLESDTRQTVVWLLKNAFADSSGAQFVQIGQVLAEIAGEDNVTFFLKTAYEDPARRPAALWALGEMARQPDDVQRERVIARLLENFQEGEWQQEVRRVLMQLLKELYAQRVSMTLIERVMAPMVRIPAGEFLYGEQKKRIELPEFWIDRTPVTQAEYKQFIDANPNHRVPYVDENWARPYNWDQQTRTYPPDQADHPVVLVSWHDARAYAEWAGKALPTEEEWEKAARGTDGREYPWGDKFDKEKCNTGEPGIGSTTPVGRYSPRGDSPYGCVDMAGNVWEWTASDWGKTSTSKVLRGGSWYHDVRYARAAAPRHSVADNRYSNLGFRCSGG